MMDFDLDKKYKNGSGKEHSFRIVWQESFGLIYISFYDEMNKEMLFEDELSRSSAIVLRKCLTQVIKSTTKKRSKG